MSWCPLRVSLTRYSPEKSLDMPEISIKLDFHGYWCAGAHKLLLANCQKATSEAMSNPVGAGLPCPPPIYRPSSSPIRQQNLTRVGFFEHGDKCPNGDNGDNGDKCPNGDKYRSTRKPRLGNRYPPHPTSLRPYGLDLPPRHISVRPAPGTHKGPSTPNPAPCHYISPDLPPRSRVHRAVAWGWGALQNVVARGG